MPGNMQTLNPDQTWIWNAIITIPENAPATLPIGAKI